MGLPFLNRCHQRIPQHLGADLLQGEFRCHECGHFLVDRGYWNGSTGTRVVQWRCLTKGCAQDSANRKPIDTTWTALRLI